MPVIEGKVVVGNNILSTVWNVAALKFSFIISMFELIDYTDSSQDEAILPISSTAICGSHLACLSGYFKKKRTLRRQ